MQRLYGFLLKEESVSERGAAQIREEANRGLFDHFAQRSAELASRAPFITFLLVALLQNTQRRGEQAINKKLDALADGMADLMSHFADEDNDLRKEIEDLKAAVGLEEEV
jgi:hypothetical protein